MDGIVIEGLISKIVTTADGGWNLTFSVNQDCVSQIMQLSSLRDDLLQMVLIPSELVHKAAIDV